VLNRSAAELRRIIGEPAQVDPLTLRCVTPPDEKRLATEAPLIHGGLFVLEFRRSEAG
jgi:hypothetical protein